MHTIGMFHGEQVSAFRHQLEPGEATRPPTITIYPHGQSDGGFVSVIWNLTVEQARKVRAELDQAIASVSGEGEA